MDRVASYTETRHVKSWPYEHLINTWVFKAAGVKEGMDYNRLCCAVMSWPFDEHLRVTGGWCQAGGGLHTTLCTDQSGRQEKGGGGGAGLSHQTYLCSPSSVSSPSQERPGWKHLVCGVGLSDYLQ